MTPDTTAAPARDIRKLARFDLLAAGCQDQIERAQRDIAKWSEDLKKNPVNALEWGEDAFMAAARVDCFTRLKFVFETMNEKGAEIIARDRPGPEMPFTSATHCTRDQVRTYAISQLSRSGRITGGSSSASRNFIGQCVQQTWLDIGTGSFGADFERVFVEAQFKDPEFNAEIERRAAILSADKAAKYAAEAAAKAQAIKDRRAAQRAARAGEKAAETAPAATVEPAQEGTP